MAEFTVIPGSSLPISTTGAADDYIFLLVDLGGGNYRLDRIKREDYFKLAPSESIDLDGFTFNNNTVISINGTPALIYGDVETAFKTNQIAFEVQDGIGFLLAGLMADGSIGLLGNGVGSEVFIKGTNRGASDVFLPKAPGVDGTLIGMGTSVQELVPVNSASDEVTRVGNKVPVLLSPAGAINPYDIELDVASDWDPGTEIIFHNPTGNNITGLTWTLNGSTNGSLPTSINAGTTARIMLFGTTWYEI